MQSTSDNPFDHRQLVEHFVAVHGGWAGLADELVRRLHLAGQQAPDLEAARKGLRRLAARTSGSGGQYGRWLLRYFGVPTDVAQRLRWLATYHSRFSDLPSTVRREHLRLWDRPPTTESKLVVWVHLGLASVFHRADQPAECLQRLAAARRACPPDDAFASVELGLLDARLASDTGDPQRVTALLTQVDERLSSLEEGPQMWCYRTRWVGQWAFQLTRLSDDPQRFHIARQRFEALPSDTGIPFVDYRRCAGLAYQSWRIGDTQAGRRLARQAAEHAGDGGFVRFRVMALNLLARMSESEEAARLRSRAARLAASIEDAHLQAVSERSWK